MVVSRLAALDTHGYDVAFLAGEGVGEAQLTVDSAVERDGRDLVSDSTLHWWLLPARWWSRISSPLRTERPLASSVDQSTACSPYEDRVAAMSEKSEVTPSTKTELGRSVSETEPVTRC